MEYKKVFFAGTIHFFVDIYSAFFPVYLVIAGLDPVKSALIYAAAAFAGNAMQPVLGFYVDRVRGKLPILLAMVLGSVCMSSIGLTQDYIFLFILIFFGKIGVSLFHPAGSNIAGGAGGEKKELAFSVFATIGTIGFSLSHPAFSFFTASFGTRASFLLALPALVIAFLYLVAGKIEIQGSDAEISLSELKKIFYERRKPLIQLFFIMVFRQAFTVAVGFFIATLFRDWGFDRIIYSSVNTIFLIAGAAGMPVSGFLAFRMKAKNLLTGSCIGFIPFFSLFLIYGNAGNLLPAFVFLAISGFILSLGHVPNIVMGQRLVPEMTSTVSGLLMGFAWSVGNFSQPLVALLKDTIPVFPGFISGFVIMFSFPAVAALIALSLPGEIRQR